MRFRLFYPALFLGVFLLLLALRQEVLFYPPYWDSILGLFTEALWLHTHAFDFVKLAFEEPGYGYGGARNLYFTVYPAFQALAMGWFGRAAPFLLFNHLLTFALAALVMVLFFRLLEPQTGRWTATCGMALLLTHPLFLSQTDALNYEMAVLACSLLAFDATLHGRPVLGALLALMGMFIKPPGVIGVAALGLFHLLRPGRDGNRSHAALWLSGAGVALCFLQWRMRALFHRELLDTVVVFLRGSMKRLLLDLPDLLILFALCGLFSAVVGYRCWLSRKGSPGASPAGPPPAHLLVGLFFACYIGFYIHIVPMLPRYFLYSLPFLLYGAVAGVQAVAIKPYRIAGILMLTGGMFLANLRGQYYPAVTTHDGFLLERSLEYLDDMRLNISLAKRLETQYYDVTIVTSYPYAHMFALPEMGYVTRPLAAVTIDGPLRHGGAAYRAALAASTRDTVWVYAPNCFSSRYAYYPHEDRLIEAVSHAGRQVLIFHNIE